MRSSQPQRGRTHVLTRSQRELTIRIHRTPQSASNHQGNRLPLPPRSLTYLVNAGPEVPVDPGQRSRLALARARPWGRPCTSASRRYRSGPTRRDFRARRSSPRTATPTPTATIAATIMTAALVTTPARVTTSSTSADRRASHPGVARKGRLRMTPPWRAPNDEAPGRGVREPSRPVRVAVAEQGHDERQPGADDGQPVARGPADGTIGPGGANSPADARK